jgi:hypothetical protein
MKVHFENGTFEIDNGTKLHDSFTEKKSNIKGTLNVKGNEISQYSPESDSQLWNAATKTVL